MRKQETDPGEPYAADSVRQHVSQYWRVRVASREVGVKPRMLPVSYLQQRTV